MGRPLRRRSEYLARRRCQCACASTRTTERVSLQRVAPFDGRLPADAHWTFRFANSSFSRATAASSRNARPASVSTVPCRFRLRSRIPKMNFQKLLRAFWPIFLFCLKTYGTGCSPFKVPKLEIPHFNMPERDFFRIDEIATVRAWTAM